jgi:predicted acyltransferase (DUF342 family)
LISFHTQIFIFQIGGTFAANSRASINLGAGVQAKNVFWVVAGAVTIGTNANMVGTILAKTMVAMQTGSSLKGRILAQTAATLQMVTIEKDELSPADRPAPPPVLPPPQPVTEPIVMGTAENFSVLTMSGISTVPTSSIQGDIGVSPIAATAITGFSLLAPLITSATGHVYSNSAQVQGKVWAADYLGGTAGKMTEAINDMKAAYTQAANAVNNVPANKNIGGGSIGSLTFVPGVYTWTTNVNIATDITLSGDGIYIFQITGNLDVASAKQVMLSGGANPSNIFWQVAGLVNVGTTAHMEGTILSKTLVRFLTGSTLRGRIMAQTAAVLQMVTIEKVDAMRATAAPAPAPAPAVEATKPNLGSAAVYGVACGGAVGVGAFSSLTGDVVASGAFSAAADAIVIGNVDVLGAFSLGAKTSFFGEVQAGGAFTIGAGGKFGSAGNQNGKAFIGTAATLGAGAIAYGEMKAAAAVTMGAAATWTGAMTAGGAITIGAAASVSPAGRALTASILPSSNVADVLADVSTAYDAIMALSAGTDLSAAISATGELPAGIYDSPAAWPLAAGKTLTLIGDGDSVFIIRVQGAVAIAGDILLGAGVLESNVYWAVNGAFAIGAGSEVHGNIITPAAIAVAAGAEFHGNLYSTKGACDIAAKATVVASAASTASASLKSTSLSATEFQGNAAAAPVAPASEPFPTLEVVIAVVAFLLLVGVGVWYQQKSSRANSLEKVTTTKDMDAVKLSVARNLVRKSSLDLIEGEEDKKSYEAWEPELEKEKASWSLEKRSTDNVISPTSAVHIQNFGSSGSGSDMGTPRRRMSGDRTTYMPM